MRSNLILFLSVFFVMQISAETFTTMSFADRVILKNITDDSFVNVLTTNSDGNVSYVSSVNDVATVDAITGEVTITGIGNTLITATCTKTANFDALSMSYTLVVKPEDWEKPDGWQIETFDYGVSNNNVNALYWDPAANATTEIGITWTTLFGAVRNALAEWDIARSNYAVLVSGKSSGDRGYAKTDSITGGINSLGFDWIHPNNDTDLDISIYINNFLVGSIIHSGGVKPPIPYKFIVDDLKIEGKFVIRFVNNSTSNKKARVEFDNIEWTPYSISTSVESVSHRVAVSVKGDQVFIEQTPSSKTQYASVYNIYGQKIHEQIIVANSTIIDRSFDSGVYVVYVGNQATKIIIQ